MSHTELFSSNSLMFPMRGGRAVSYVMGWRGEVGGGALCTRFNEDVGGGWRQASGETAPWHDVV